MGIGDDDYWIKVFKADYQRCKRCELSFDLNPRILSNCGLCTDGRRAFHSLSELSYYVATRDGFTYQTGLDLVHVFNNVKSLLITRPVNGPPQLVIGECKNALLSASIIPFVQLCLTKSSVGIIIQDSGDFNLSGLINQITNDNLCIEISNAVYMTSHIPYVLNTSVKTLTIRALNVSFEGGFTGPCVTAMKIMSNGVINANNIMLGFPFLNELIIHGNPNMTGLRGSIKIKNMKIVGSDLNLLRMINNQMQTLSISGYTDEINTCIPANLHRFKQVCQLRLAVCDGFEALVGTLVRVLRPKYLILVLTNCKRGFGPQAADLFSGVKSLKIINANKEFIDDCLGHISRINLLLGATKDEVIKYVLDNPLSKIKKISFNSPGACEYAKKMGLEELSSQYGFMYTFRAQN